MIDFKIFGQEYKTIRKHQKRLTMQEVSDRSGVSKALICQLERGHVENMTIRTMTRLTEAVGEDLFSMLYTVARVQGIATPRRRMKRGV